MAKETTVNVETGIVKTTFSTKCNSVETELNISFDFSNLTQEQVYELALRSAIIDFQRTIRPLTQNEAIEKYDGTVVIVGEKRKRVVSLSVKLCKSSTRARHLQKTRPRHFSTLSKVCKQKWKRTKNLPSASKPTTNMATCRCEAVFKTMLLNPKLEV